MIRSHLMPDNRPTLQWTVVVGVNRHVCTWPINKLTLWYTFEILIVDDLSFLILLGRDTLGFGVLIQKAIREAIVEELRGGELDLNPDEEPN